MNTYTVDNLSVNCSLNAGTIYLKVVDTASFATFETKYEPVVASSIEDTHTLMCNCLSKQTHHTCEFHMENSNMRITFDAKVGGYFNVHFDVFHRERIGQIGRDDCEIGNAAEYRDGVYPQCIVRVATLYGGIIECRNTSISRQLSEVCTIEFHYDNLRFNCI